MKKLLIFIFITVAILFVSSTPIFAKNDPTSVPNNKFGIHINDENDLDKAAELVDSSGGDWGYITFVITEAERDHDRWQKVFDQLRRRHLIPIVRIASKANGDVWEIPQEAEINNWIAFLNSLNWVTENRYIVIGNEPNHANEWGGKIDPEAYATYLNEFAQKLHEASSDFYVLPAGLDASAKNTRTTIDESIYLKRMLKNVPNLFDNIDGWTSHSYPNPGFSGMVTDTGKGTVTTYNWELSYLLSLGVTKNLPVFITETGWSNIEVSPSEISKMYEYAFKNIWNDKRIVAVTPFILNYPNEPFSSFSWLKKDGSTYSYYDAYKNIAKDAGSPVQRESGQILGAIAQPVIVSGSNFVGAILAKNTGESIWTNGSLILKSDDESVSFNSSLLFDVEPTKTGLITFTANPNQKAGILFKSIYFENTKSKRITNSFPIEAIIVKINQSQIQSYFQKIIESFKAR